jgi:multidrug resistance efflux pump
MRRLILIPLLMVIAILAIGGGIAYVFYNNYMFYNTDDAQVNGTIVNVSAPATGMLDTLTVKIGDTISAGQIIGTVTPALAASTSSRGVSAAINVISPISGTVLQVSAVTGQGVTPGLPIVQVTDLSQVNVIAYVNEGAINNISNGQSVDITVDAYSGSSFSGHVQQIVQATAGQFSLLPTQDNASGNFTKVGQRIPVLIRLDGTGGKDLVPGMSAEVTIHLH